MGVRPRGLDRECPIRRGLLGIGLLQEMTSLQIAFCTLIICGDSYNPCQTCGL